MANKVKLASRIKYGYIESNDAVPFPQTQSVSFGAEGLDLTYVWNSEGEFMTITLVKSKKILFKSKILEGGKYIVYAPRYYFRLTGIKTICVFYPITVNQNKCIMKAYWQEEE